MAGINAGRRAQLKDQWYPRRDEAYLGVLVDDLVTMGTKEPYRMFTSRAEYRLMLREDNADQRLTAIAREMGLIDDERWVAYQGKLESLEKEVARLKDTWIYPSHPEAKQAEGLMDLPLSKEQTLFDLLKRPKVAYNALAELDVFGEGILDATVVDQIEIQAKYSGYIDRQMQQIEKVNRSESVEIPTDLDLDSISGLSNEVKQKIRDHKPANLGMASRVQGITPAAISILLIAIKKARASGGQSLKNSDVEPAVKES